MALIRKILFWLHLVAGCVTAIAVFAMALSGAVLAFERQLTNWAEMPTVTAPQSATATPAPLESVLKAVDGRGQGAPSQLTLYKNQDKPVAAVWGRQTTVYVNPYTAEVIPEAATHRTRDFLQLMMKVHRALGAEMRNATARGLADAANLIFLFIVVSGLYLWLPKVWSATQVKMRLWFRGGLKGKALEWNWHHVIGIWTLIPLFVVVLTGVIISYGWASNLLYTMTGSPVPVRRGPGGPGGPGAAGGPAAPASGAREDRNQAGGGAARPAKPAGAADRKAESGTPAAAQEQPASPREGRGGHDGAEGRGPGAGEGRGPADGQDRGARSGEGRGSAAPGEHGPRGEQAAGAAHPGAAAATAQASKPSSDKPARPTAKPEAHPAAAAVQPPAVPAIKALNELVGVATTRIPEWKSVSIQSPGQPGRTLSIAVDKSIGGQPEKVITLTLDRASGEVVSTRTFADNNLGQRLRTYARMVHTGEEFGILGEIIGALICIGTLFLVWTGVSLTVRRAAAAIKRGKKG